MIDSHRAYIRNILQKVKELQADEASAKEKLLWLSIEAGGCSGFQYTFSLDDKTNADDRFAQRILTLVFLLGLPTNRTELSSGSI